MPISFTTRNWERITKMNWLITGGCGFLGTALIKRLLQQGGNNIRVLDNLATGTRDDLRMVAEYRELTEDSLAHAPSGVELVVCDVMDEYIALKISRGFDIIVHFAANTGVGPSVDNPRADMMANVIGTFNYLEAARINKIPRFIFASSGAPAGEVEPPIHEEIAPHPVSPYGASKLAGEGYCSAYKRSFGIDTVILRFGNVYGPGSVHKSSVVANLIRRALEGKTLEIYGDGTQTRDFIYIEDLIDAVMIAASAPSIGGEAFQIATNLETTVGEMVEKLVAIMQLAGINDVKLIRAETRLGDVKRNFSDTTKAKRMLGWQSKISLDNGLKKTVAYFLEK